MASVEPHGFCKVEIPEAYVSIGTPAREHFPVMLKVERNTGSRVIFQLTDQPAVSHIPYPDRAFVVSR